MILAGDVGGTNSRLALFEESSLLALEIFPSAHYASLRDVVKAFRGKHSQPVEAACLAVAGPVLEGKSHLPNLPWPEIDASQLAQDLGAPVRLANDLEANAYGIAVLTPEDLVPVNIGAPNPSGNRVLISAGTGLGEAGLLSDNGEYKPWACEGGHCDFAPRNPTEIALLEFLMKEFDHVSCERVLSGPGLHNIYRFLRDTGRAEEPRWLAERLAAEDASAVISELGMKYESSICVQALELFVAIYGAEAGNLALKGLATGGVYIGGGIAPKILQKLLGRPFLEGFCSKGRSRPLMESMPIHVILNDKTALLGAGRLAISQIPSTQPA